MRGGEKCSFGWRRGILVSWWSGRSRIQVPSGRMDGNATFEEKVRSIGKADQAGVWRSLFLKDVAGIELHQPGSFCNKYSTLKNKM